MHCGFIDGSNDNLLLSYVKSIQLHITKNFKKVSCGIRSKFFLLTPAFFVPPCCLEKVRSSFRSLQQVGAASEFPLTRRRLLKRGKKKKTTTNKYKNAALCATYTLLLLLFFLLQKSIYLLFCTYRDVYLEE